MSNTEDTRTPVTLKRKFVHYEVERTPRPDPSLDIMKMFQRNSNTRVDSANHWTIDVFPNMVPIIMLIISSAIRHYDKVTDRSYSKITTSTLCMYYLCIVYGFFLINDLEVRPKTSAHGDSWKNVSWKRDFVHFLRTLPVPEFLTVILNQFHAAETDRTKNLFFIPCAAGYDHNQFFGRVFPVKFFADIHDCLANLTSSSSQEQILQYLYKKPLYTITGGLTCLIPDLIGVTLDRTQNRETKYMNSKLYQVFNCLFNPVLFRDVQRRPTLAALSFEPPTYENNHVNAYDMMFSATASNLGELQIVLQAVSSVLTGSDIPMSGQLDAYIAGKSGNSILMHGYSSYALPTWSHTDLANKVGSFETLTSHTIVTPDDRATDFSFLQRPEAALPTTREVIDVSYVANEARTTTIALPTGHSLVRTFPGSLRNDADAAQPFPRHDNNNLVKFSAHRHTTPQVLVLDTEGNDGINAHLATLTGKVIECFEIDGSTVPHPSNDRTLGPQNCLFADSAIPYKYVRPGSDFKPRAAGEILPPLARSVPSSSSTRHAAASLLYSRNLVLIPRFQRLINEALGNTLPGMTIVNGAVSARYTQSMVGFNTCDTATHEPTTDSVPAMPTGRLLVWSPYTFTAYESGDWPTADLSQSKHYYLTNLRTIFGTDYNLVEVTHAYKAFPVV